MAQTQTLALIQEIESLVSHKLQVVSYKWLCRNYMISSDEAKRLLQGFVQKHGGGLEVVYKVSGWLKSSHPSYHMRLVTGATVAAAQEEFDGNCSVHVYSVQASIPKDPAVLWNAEFIQAEELFKQPSSVDNCLRDNRLCGVFNSFVRRNVDGSPVVSSAPDTKSALDVGPTKSNIVRQNNAFPKPQKNKAHDSIPEVDLKSQNVVKDVKSESNGTEKTVAHDHINKPADKEKVLPLPTGKKKVHPDKSCSASGGSLASFWGRASSKPNSCSLPAENSNTVSNPSVAAAFAQTGAHEAGESDSGDDDGQDVKLKRSSNSEKLRKRRVVFDFSDEDEHEDAINLASPDFPNKESSQDHIQSDKKSPEKAILNFDMQIENKSKVKEEIRTDQKADQRLREDFSVISKCTSTGKSSIEKSQDNVNNAASSSPKRKKVMKTRIDERGREVTEVVREGEETEAKKADKVTTKKADNNVSTNAVNSAPAAKKSPAIANTISNPNGKGGSKKAGNLKDPKQGNLLSFFKRV